jgi:hypothetical protein
MLKDRDWCDQSYRGHFGAFTIVEGHGPVTRCGEGLIVALHDVRGPEALCGERLIVILHDVRGQLPLWQGAHRRTQPVAIIGKGFVVAFFGKRLVVALLDGCVLLGVLAILALGDVHDVFGVLDVLALGDIHAFGDVHAVFGVLAVLDLSILAPLVIVWRDMVDVASCAQEHESLIVAWESNSFFPRLLHYCRRFLQYDI